MKTNSFFLLYYPTLILPYLHGEAARASATGSVKDALLGPAPATRVAEMLPEVIARLIAE